MGDFLHGRISRWRVRRFAGDRWKIAFLMGPGRNQTSWRNWKYARAGRERTYLLNFWTCAPECVCLRSGEAPIDRPGGTLALFHELGSLETVGSPAIWHQTCRRSELKSRSNRKVVSPAGECGLRPETVCPRLGYSAEPPLLAVKRLELSSLSLSLSLSLFLSLLFFPPVGKNDTLVRELSWSVLVRYRGSLHEA